MAAAGSTRSQASVPLILQHQQIHPCLVALDLPRKQGEIALSPDNKAGIVPWHVPQVTSLPRSDPAAPPQPAPPRPPSARKQSLGKDQKRAFRPEMKGWSHHPAIPSLPRDRQAQEDLGDPSHPVWGTSKGAPLIQPCPVLPVTAMSPHQVRDQPKGEEGHELTYKPSSGSGRSHSSSDTDLALGHRGRHAQQGASPAGEQEAGGWPGAALTWQVQTVLLCQQDPILESCP